jgi:hypothetical protein
MARACSGKMAQYGSVEDVCLSIKTYRGWAMDIPNDLNKLLAQLKQVTRETSRMRETWAPSGSRPNPR